MEKKDFLKIIKKQRSSKKAEKFNGTFLEYLKLVQENPDIISPAHKTLYDTINAYGSQPMEDSNPRKHKIFDSDNIKIYDYFNKEFFGMEKVISKLMRYLKSAALKGEESRQVLLLMGPVGAGKSALTEHIKSSLEGIPFYHLKGDPQRGEPLHLIPRSLRNQFAEMLGVSIDRRYFTNR